MIDLSNNNPEPIDFRKVYAAGHRRVYLKLTEGATFVDSVGHRREAAAVTAGLMVGFYHYAHPELNSPGREASFFLRQLGWLNSRTNLRPVLDLEAGTPSRGLVEWVNEFRAIVRRRYPMVIYGSTAYLGAIGWPAPPCPLWLASYGPDDGQLHVPVVPRPWSWVAAHQFTSKGAVEGVTGHVDVSRVYNEGSFALAADAA